MSVSEQRKAWNPGSAVRLMNHAALALTAAALGGSVLIFLALPVLAYRWVQLPFMGAFVEQTLVFNSVGPHGNDPWAGIDAGLRFPQQLTAIADQPVRSTTELTRALAAHQPGETVTLAYRDADGMERQASITLHTFPTYDLFAYFIVPYLIGLAYLAIGLWMFRLRRNEAAGRAFVLFCTAVAAVVGGLFDLYTTHVFSWAWTLALAVAAGALLTLALIFPQEIPLVARWPALRWSGFIPAGILAVLGERALYDMQHPTAYAAAWLNEYALIAASLLAFLGFTLYRRARAPSPIVRQQARIILWGSALGFAPIIYYLVLSTARVPIVFNVSLYFPPLILFPLATAYAILRYRLLDVNYLVGQGLTYGLLTVGGVAVYLLLLNLFGLLLGHSLPGDSPIVIALFVFVLTAGFNYAHSRAQRLIDRLFYRQRVDYRNELAAFSHKLTRTIDLDAILRALHDRIGNTLNPSQATTFLFDEDAQAYLSSAPLPEARFKPEDGLAQTMRATEAPIYILGDERPASLGHDLPAIERLNLVVFVPLKSEGRLPGWLALGRKRSGEPYSNNDLIFLAALADQSALAVENARLLAETQRRVEELTGLHEIAQAFGALTDVRETFGALTERLAHLIDAPICTIMLYDPASGELRAQAPGYGASDEKLATLYYPARAARELWDFRKHGVFRFNSRAEVEFPPIIEDHVEAAGVESALIAPMWVEGRFVGTVFAINKPSGFSEDDARMLGVFAGQAAAVIENARLFEETQRRVEELTGLHEIAQAFGALTDVRETFGALTERLAHLINAPICTIMLYDPASGELRAQAPGYGASDEKLAALHYPARATRELWDFRKRGVFRVNSRAEVELPALLHDFVESVGVESALVAPMWVEGRFVGTVFAINKPSGFSEDDARMLGVFAGQAAAMIENARLFEETQRRLQHVQALRAVDLAITGSLDLYVTLSVLLDQVATQLKVDAADVLLFNPQTQMLEYATRRGFRTRALQQTRLRLDEGQAGRAALEQRIISISDFGAELSDLGFPQSTIRDLQAEAFVAYYAVPLVTKGQVKGVLEVFHRAPLDPDQEWLDFLHTLAAQAAIAIENATLFKDLQRSNVELTLAYDATLEGWVRALDLRDKETEGHTRRVTEMTMRLARALGISDEEQMHISRGALLHDIGKMGVPDNILRKPGPLTDEEWAIMRQHPVYAHEMLAPITFLKAALDIPYCHHEKWDGTGYPRGLESEAIPLAARIFAVADVWDALRSDRPYREAWPEEKVLEYIHSQTAAHFDPQVVGIFLKVMRSA